jgi:hypothetical protein
MRGTSGTYEAPIGNRQVYRLTSGDPLVPIAAGGDPQWALRLAGHQHVRRRRHGENDGWGSHRWPLR